jgi:hypothetical protein
LCSSFLLFLPDCAIISSPKVGGVGSLAYLELLIFSSLSPLEIADPGDKFNHFLAFERRMIVTLDVVLVTDLTNELFALGNATVMGLTNVTKPLNKKIAGVPLPPRQVLRAH